MFKYIFSSSEQELVSAVIRLQFALPGHHTVYKYVDFIV